jgi:hypothetical protein
VILLKIVRFAVGDRRNDTVLYGVLDGEALHALLGQPWDGLDLAGPVYASADCRLLAPVAPPDVWAIGS